MPWADTSPLETLIAPLKSKERWQFTPAENIPKHMWRQEFVTWENSM